MNDDNRHKRSANDKQFSDWLAANLPAPDLTNHDDKPEHQHYFIMLYDGRTHWGTHKECSCSHETFDRIFAGRPIDLGEYVHAKTAEELAGQMEAALDGSGSGLHVMRLWAVPLAAIEYANDLCTIIVVQVRMEQEDLGYRMPPPAEGLINLSEVQERKGNMVHDWMGEGLMDIRSSDIPEPDHRKPRLN